MWCRTMKDAVPECERSETLVKRDSPDRYGPRCKLTVETRGLPGGRPGFPDGDRTFDTDAAQERERSSAIRGCQFDREAIAFRGLTLPDARTTASSAQPTARITSTVAPSYEASRDNSWIATWRAFTTSFQSRP